MRMSEGDGAARGGSGCCFQLVRTPRGQIDSWRLRARRGTDMETIKFVHWEEEGAWIGYLQDYPDYWTQGDTLEDLKDHLRDLYRDLTSGQLQGVRKVDELVVS
jgi:hypothetical protein